VTTSSTPSDSGELPGAPKLATARDVSFCGAGKGEEHRRSCYVWDDKVGFLRQRRAAGEVVRAWIEQQDAAGEVASRPGAGLRG
jgi:hypothetical protein